MRCRSAQEMHAYGGNLLVGHLLSFSGFTQALEMLTLNGSCTS